MIVLLSSGMMFQSTLPQGSDEYDRPVIFGYDVSIHAPTRERLDQGRKATGHLGFNPRSHKGAT